MPVAIVVAMTLMVAIAAPAAAQDRFEDRLFVNALIGPGFVSDSATINSRLTVGARANRYLAAAGEFGYLPKVDPSKKEGLQIAGRHANANLYVTAPSATWANLRPYGTLGGGRFWTHKDVLSLARNTDPSMNFGAGLMYDVNRWVGITFDYRRFVIFYEDETRGANRYTAGFNIGLR